MVKFGKGVVKCPEDMDAEHSTDDFGKGAFSMVVGKG